VTKFKNKLLFSRKRKRHLKAKPTPLSNKSTLKLEAIFALKKQAGIYRNKIIHGLLVNDKCIKSIVKFLYRRGTGDKDD
jgi:hypothetical protein